MWSLLINELRRGSVAFVAIITFLGVSHAGEWTNYIPPCPDVFAKAWDAWDQSDPAKMPPLPQEPCLLISWNHIYICSRDEGGCGLPAAGN